MAASAGVGVRTKLAVVALVMTGGCTEPSEASAGPDATAPVDAAVGIDTAVVDVGKDLGDDASAEAGPDTANPPCPTPAPGSIEATLPWGEVLQHRMGSGVIVSIPIVASPSGRSAVAFTQGQQPSTPAGVVTEFTVSRCRGVIDATVPQCHVRSTFVNNNQITSFSRAVNGWGDQATLGDRGCWAPESSGPWYVNVRWTYDSCPFGSCGFSFQWTDGAW